MPTKPRNEPATPSAPTPDKGGSATSAHPPTRREPRASTSEPGAPPPADAAPSTPPENPPGRTDQPTTTRGMATDVPPKIEPPKEFTDYAVTINNKTKLVVKIEKLAERTGERKPLSQQDYVTVSAQLASAARPLAGAMGATVTPPASTVPPMLNAPAFNALAMRAALTPPAGVAGTTPQSLAQLARSLGSPGAMNAQAAPQATAGFSAAPAIADPTTLVQAYYQGVVDYLSTITGRR